MEETWVVADGLSRPELRLWCAYAAVASAGVRQRGPFTTCGSGGWAGTPAPSTDDVSSGPAAAARTGQAGKGQFVLLAPAQRIVEVSSLAKNTTDGSLPDCPILPWRRTLVA